MLSRLVMGGAGVIGRPVFSSTLLKNAVQHAPQRQQALRRYAKETRESYMTRQRAERMSIKERAMAPMGPNAFGIGKGAVAGGSVLGLGALCFYGLGMGKGQSALDQSMMWPQYVKDRIHATYLYFGGSIALSAASAMAVFKTPALLNMVSRTGIMSIVATMAVLIGSSMIVQSIPYQGGVGTKQLAWAGHCAILGAVIAPICLLGGPLLIRAAIYTAGVVGGLSTVAVCAPSDKFLMIGGPLAIGLGVVFASSIGSMFLGPSALGAGLASISIYGGLLLFSGFLLYDTQRIVRKAETYPVYGAGRPFDPVSAGMSIYMDTLNIFIRIASIMGGNKK